MSDAAFCRKSLQRERAQFPNLHLRPECAVQSSTEIKKSTEILFFNVVKKTKIKMSEDAQVITINVFVTLHPTNPVHTYMGRGSTLEPQPLRSRATLIYLAHINSNRRPQPRSLSNPHRAPTPKSPPSNANH